jgi:hypothetical protein
MGPERIVLHTPLLDSLPGFPQTGEPFLIQTFLTEPAIEALNMAVLYRLAGVNEVQLDAISTGPNIQLLATKLRPIINL